MLIFLTFFWVVNGYQLLCLRHKLSELLIDSNIIHIIETAH